mgnify:CR=1 FL=1
MKACADLLTQSFCLTWYDRFSHADAPRSAAERLDSSVGGGAPPYIALPALTQALASSTTSTSNAAQGDGMTALHWAAHNGDAELAERSLRVDKQTNDMELMIDEHCTRIIAPPGYNRWLVPPAALPP